MKKYLLLFLLIPLLFAGCNRWINREDRLVGTWKLTSAAKHRKLNRDYINTGYESGTFSFYDNGQARYTEGSLQMEGNWQLRYISGDSHYDHGEYHSGSGSRLVFSIHLVNFQSNRLLELDFDDCRFHNRDEFVAEYETVSYSYLYIFERY